MEVASQTTIDSQGASTAESAQPEREAALISSATVTRSFMDKPELKIALGLFFLLNTILFKSVFYFLPEYGVSAAFPYNVFIAIGAFVLFCVVARDLFSNFLDQFKYSNFSWDAARLLIFGGMSFSLLLAIIYLHESSVDLLEASIGVFSLLILFKEIERSLDISSRVTQALTLESFVSKKQPLRINTDSTDAQNNYISFSQGEILNCDGYVEDGHGVVLERKNSPKGYLALKEPGRLVYAGSTVLRGTLKVKAEVKAADSELSRFYGEQTPFIQEFKKGHKFYSYFERAIIFTSFAAALGSFLFWLGRGESLTVIASSMIGCLMVISFSKILIRLPLLEDASLARAFLSGLFLRDVSKLWKRLLEIKSFCFDFAFADPPGRFELKSFSLLDGRVDKERLRATAIGLLSASSQPIHRAIVDGLLKNKLPEDISRVEGIHLVGESGVIGLLDGVDLSFGSEEFLLERGVQFDLTTSQEDKSLRFYLSVHDQPLAEFSVSKPFELDGTRILDRFRDLKVRTVLLSEEPEELLDNFGAKIGFDRSDLKGALNSDAFNERLQALSPTILFERRDSLKRGDGDLIRVREFNELTWRFDDADILLFGSSLDRLPALVEDVRNSRAKSRLLLAGISLMSAILLVCSVFNFISLIWVSALLLLGLGIAGRNFSGGMKGRLTNLT